MRHVFANQTSSNALLLCVGIVGVAQVTQFQIIASVLLIIEKALNKWSLQVGFFEICAMPLFRSYVELLPAAQPMLDAVKTNYNKWLGMHNPPDGVQ